MLTCSRAGVWAAGFAVVAGLAGCDSNAPQTSAPGTITTLGVRTAAPWFTMLEWIAPPRNTPLVRYEVWMSETPAFEPPATPVPLALSIVPGPPGMREQVAIGDRRACETRYFAIVTYDGGGNPSDFSNVVQARTPEFALFADREQTGGEYMDVAADEQSVVYTTEVLGRVLGWDYAAQTIREFTVPGGAPLGSTRGVAARFGRVLVTDRLTGRVAVFDRQGPFLGVWTAANATGGALRLPLDVAVAPNGEVYIVDSRDRVVVLGPQGDYRREWGESGPGLGQFSAPAALAVDDQGRVYVLDSGNHRVQVFDAAGEFLTGWGRSGGGESEFLSPSGLAIGAGGEVLVCDFDRNDVQRFTPDGQYRGRWGGPGVARGLFSGATGIAIDPQGFVYVTESAARRLQAFGPDPTLCN